MTTSQSSAVVTAPKKTMVELLGDACRYYVTPFFLPLVERNMIPDVLVRMAIKKEIEGGVVKANKLKVEDWMKQKMDMIKKFKTMPIAVATKTANEQHYEIPDEFYQLVLGPCLKYSSGYWPSPKTTLAESEVAMLEMYCERAGIVDGMTVIDLGCGWGSVSLYLAKKYPRCKIISISNSHSQKKYIVSTAEARGISVPSVFTGDINDFDLPPELHGTADRVISIEMFEHMKNYELLMNKISRWMKQGAKLFVHIFTHKHTPSTFEEGWMTDNFFTGGTLPSDDLLLYFQGDLKIEDHWIVNGSHYQKTLEAWLVEMDSKRAQVMPILEKTYGKDNALKWYVYWRLFFIACAEFFGIEGGQQYPVSHYLFVKP